jgi:hypothetical protein
MSGEPSKPFQDARELLKAHVAAAARGAADGAGKIALTYRVSGGPPGKRLLLVLRVSAAGDVAYEHRDELRGKRTVKRKTTLPNDQTMSLLRQVHESALLDHRDTGGGFLPDSTIGSIVIESEGAQVAYHFLAEEHQQRSQNKEPPSAIRGLKLAFDGLCEAMERTRSRNTPPPNTGRRGRGGK